MKAPQRALACVLAALALISAADTAASATRDAFAPRSTAPRAVLQNLAVHSRYVALAGDFDCNGRDDIFWYAPGRAQDFVWYSTARGFVSHEYTVNGVYRPIAGDFDGDHCGDVFWYAAGSAPDYVWYGSATTRFATRLQPVFGRYVPLAGVFDSGVVRRTDIWWYDLGARTNTIWYGDGRGSFTHATSDTASVVRVVGGNSATLRPFVGDFDSNGVDDVVVYRPGAFTAAYLYGTDHRGVWSPHIQATPGDDLVPVTGDFDGATSFSDDILWYGPGTVADYLWLGTRSGTIRRRTNVRGASYTPVVGDFDGNRLDDVLWYAPGSAEESIWSAVVRSLPPAAPPYPSAIAAGGEHGCAIVAGVVKCWGDNRFGELGDGTNRSSNLPVTVLGLPRGATSVVAGFGYTCTIVSGAAYCWGLNNYGQLGDGTTRSRRSAVPVADLQHGVTAIALSDFYSGREHTCAVVGGAAGCWGYNGDGGLGDGTTKSRAVPGAVHGLNSGVTSITAGDRASCAVVHGAATCWGANDDGQLGNGSTTPSLVPVAVSGLGSGVSTIGAGPKFACARASTGAVWCWGLGTYGELGDNSFASSSVPVQAQGLTSGVTALAVGDEGACAILHAAVYCWGQGFGHVPRTSWG